MNDHLGVPAFLNRTKLVGTYTMLNCYASICPYQAYRRYVVKDIKFIPTAASEWGNRVHEAFEHRVGGGKPLPIDMQQWESFAVPFDGRHAKVEQKIGLTEHGRPCGYFETPTVRWRVKVDLALINGPTAYMIDWKTGNSRYEDPFELEIGAMHLHALHPSLTQIVGQYAWLKENRIGQMHDLSDTLATWQKANKLLSAMEAAKINNDWPKRQSKLCEYCDVRDCEFNKKPPDNE